MVTGYRPSSVVEQLRVREIYHRFQRKKPGVLSPTHRAFLLMKRGLLDLFNQDKTIGVVAFIAVDLGFDFERCSGFVVVDLDFVAVVFCRAAGKSMVDVFADVDGVIPDNFDAIDVESFTASGVLEGDDIGSVAIDQAGGVEDYLFGFFVTDFSSFPLSDHCAVLGKLVVGVDVLE